MARVWTKMQKKAIDTRDRTLLVSAAAGSGKTATLTERIIVSMLDKESPVSIDEMLIVTFTRAAVGELRERIGRALREAMKENPASAELERQLYLLPSAKISTIDSFCASILRANADRVGVSPDFRIADTAEAEMLAEGILDGLISAIYEGDEEQVATPDELERLSECMTDTRSEGELALVILSLYNSTLSSLEGVGSIKALVSEYDPASFSAVENTRLGAYAIKLLMSAAEHYSGALVKIRAELLGRDEKKLAKMLEVIESDIEFLARLMAQKTYTGIRDVLSSYEFPRTPSLRDDTLPPITPLRRAMREDLSDRLVDCFSFTDSDWRTAYSELYKILSVLVNILYRFDELFVREKIRRGMLEYSDIERLTYECLWQGGELTDVALSEKRLYKAVYIDEYQDVNSLQNKIFEAVSTDRNRFMVGDIKQSIYGFRSANTDIFAEMKRTFPSIESSGDSPNASIFMSDNFRCDRGVIDFVNRVFDTIFSRLRESIGYLDGDRLSFSKIHEGGEPEYRFPEICIASPDSFSDMKEDMSEREASAMTVAMKIRELLDGGVLDNGRRISAGDIAVIMRNARGREGVYKAALDSMGIPSAVADDTRFFLNSEVLLALCLLNSIDNPRRDIYLAGLLASPLYSFTPSELAIIGEERKETLYDSLVSYTERHSYEKGARFIKELSRYRTLSEGMPTYELLSLLFGQTGLLAIASERGSRDNLMLLYENARKFEAGSYRGLYNFITYINGVIDRRNSFDKREAPDKEDAVRIITAHSSKGLEYPIVFFVGAEESFNSSRGAAPRYVYKEGFGIGLYARTPSGLSLVENPTKAIINEYVKRRSLEEEARVLYVALTRARERLYVIAAPKKERYAYLSDIAVKREYLSDYSVYGLSSFAELILASGEFKTLSNDEFCSSSVKITDTRPDVCLPVEEPEGDPVPALTSDVLRGRFSYEYPYKRRTLIPEKVSVSKLYPRLFDESDTQVLDLEAIDAEEEKAAYVPAFISGDTGDSKARGIATHLFLQFCDLEGLLCHGAKEELRILTDKKYISVRDSGLVRIKEAEMFLSSRLFGDMRSAMKVWRELRFNVKLPCEMFATELAAAESLKGEKVLVQGVIDCLILDTDGEYHLVDYKTDRLTREEMADRSLAEQRLRKSHSRQLGYYAEAVKIMFGKYPATVEVYSLPLGDTVDVRDERMK